MAWEERAGRRYYYRKVRKGGRVFSVYEGGGISGTLAEAQDAEARQSRQRKPRSLRAELAAQDAIDAKIDEAWRVVERVAAEALQAAGYHQHKRQWRLKRNGKPS
ncbi:MAG TPA: hypothetical protein VJ866_12225 [Pyrinomonadaceae bacterium]|nr:hypothetical protein [Pyrinomonadaceae bacterium]